MSISIDLNAVVKVLFFTPDVRMVHIIDGNTKSCTDDG
jgi:hypothetical protein